CLRRPTQLTPALRQKSPALGIPNGVKLTEGWCYCYNSIFRRPLNRWVTMIRRSWHVCRLDGDDAGALDVFAARCQRADTGVFTQECVAANARHFLDRLLGGEPRKTGWMRAEAAGDPGPWRQQAVLGRGRWDAEALCDIVPPPNARTAKNAAVAPGLCVEGIGAATTLAAWLLGTQPLPRLMCASSATTSPPQRVSHSLSRSGGMWTPSTVFEVRRGRRRLARRLHPHEPLWPDAADADHRRRPELSEGHDGPCRHRRAPPAAANFEHR
ncbi:hypothetical protein QO011_008535, partial [Labrys wisconsinensis]|nr:hypothetical protein [Labrys wisconsinensis]